MKLHAICIRPLLWAVLLTAAAQGAPAPADSNTPQRPASFGDKGFFPIGVWVQDPANALRYRAAGFNLYVGLWSGPTDAQLRLLKRAKMSLICDQNQMALSHINDSTIVGWMQVDEPDNAQSLGGGGGYGPPVLPEKVIERYRKMRAADPNRPVLLNLGQGVAWDGWYGRGVRTNHPEDYPLYVQGCDIVSFDIYPASHSNPQVAGQLWYVARGVERLVEWTGGQKPVWNVVECTHIHNPTSKATPQQVRCEVWMSIIHGSTGLVYFVHEWQPKFNESALLSDLPMLRAVTVINRRIQELAPVLNSPTVVGQVTVASAKEQVPVATVVKRDENHLYLFAVAMRGEATSAQFTFPALSGARSVTVLDENRTLQSQDGVFTDDFAPWDVHLYRIPAGAQ
jgi:hypothetical protein